MKAINIIPIKHNKCKFITYLRAKENGLHGQWPELYAATLAVRLALSFCKITLPQDCSVATIIQ